MVPSLFTALSLAVIYRVTINLPDLPYSSDLRRPGSPEYFAINKKVVDAIDGLLTPVPGDFRASVLNYRYHQVIGTLATIDIYADRETPLVKKAFLEAIDDGDIGDLAVASDGFEFHVIKGSGGSCNPQQFACLDGTCIDAKLRCDGIADCDDKSDEIADFAMCKRSLPVISLSKKSVDIPLGGTVQLSAVIHRVPVGHQVIWSRNDEIIGQGGIKTVTNPRLHVYRSADEYFIRIENAHSSDSGTYSVQVEGYALKAKIPVKIHTEDALKSETAGCPPGERACKSGHCFPTYYFCDRHVHCPDGDDEINCSVVTCRSSEFKCASENTCISHASVCDGVRDCRDGSDERNCSTPMSTARPFLSSRPTVTCPDGSTPEFSLHGSTYCWSNSVCPIGSVCLQSQCCRTAMSENLRLCPEWKWECGTGRCVDMEKRCDGVVDCQDHSDEMHCDLRWQAYGANTLRANDKSTGNVSSTFSKTTPHNPWCSVSFPQPKD
ncbi:hypothetical protein QR680_000954 [Steinernema hermaphroditum]|uniref:Ig-like domain-containing protein n=1 Tax=Steinernema hermaphroditum TaxID=289476 RepID=A0AA39LEK3_9BILA|nr:hypothetical protein QR680_000954 [Steinernema hermaphroditum]